jgi:hypothetical protein
MMENLKYYLQSKYRLSVADEIEKELDGALPCEDDMVRAERLQGLRVNSYEITISS